MGCAAGPREPSTWLGSPDSGGSSRITWFTMRPHEDNGPGRGSDAARPGEDVGGQVGAGPAWPSTPRPARAGPTPRTGGRSPLGGLAERDRPVKGIRGLAGLHPLVAGDDQRLGLGVAALAQQGARPAGSSRHIATSRRASTLSRIARPRAARLGLGPPRLLQQIRADRDEVFGQDGAVGLDGLAAASQHVATQPLGLGPAAERS